MRKLRNSVLIVLSIFGLGLLIFGGYVIYQSIALPEADKLFPKAIELMYSEFEKGLENQPMLNLDKYEIYGRMKTSVGDGTTTMDSELDYGMRFDKENKFMDIESKFLKNNEHWYTEKYYQRTGSYVEYPDILDGRLLKYEEEISASLDLELLEMIKIVKYTLETVKEVSLEIYTIDNVDYDLVTLDNGEEGLKVYLDLDEKTLAEFIKKGDEFLAKNEDYAKYMEENLAEEEEEDPGKYENGQVIVYLTKKKKEFVKFEQITDGKLEASVTKENGNMKISVQNEDKDFIDYEIGEKKLGFNGNIFYQGDTLKVLYEFNFDTKTANRAIGDMNISMESANNNAGFKFGITGNFTFNSVNVLLDEIDESTAINMTELTQEETLKIYNFFQEQVNTPSST